MTAPAPVVVSQAQLTVTLVLALVCLLAWILLAFVFPLGVGFVHLLLGAGTTLLVRWWALRNA
jgi:hypothetical protein